MLHPAVMVQSTHSSIHPSIHPSQVPNTFFDNGGGYPVKTLLSLIALLFGFTCVFDVAFLLLNYYTTQCLPLIMTWRRIKKAQLW